MIHKLFMKKENRDREFKRLREQGYNVRRTRSTNQLLHPMYVEDWPGKLSAEDKGFGNNLYKTYFPVLYGIEEKWRP